MLIAAVLLFSGCPQQEDNIQTEDNNANNDVVPVGPVDMSNIAEIGDTVMVMYEGIYLKENNEPYTFDKATISDPMTFTLGETPMIDGFENAIVGMEVGEEKNIEIPYEEGYGAWNEENIVEFDLNNVESQIGYPPKEGMWITADGMRVQILEINPDTNKVKIDMNHELAGKTIYFWIKLVEVRKAEPNQE